MYHMQFWVLKMIGQTKIIKNHKATKLGHPMDLRTCNRMPKTPGWRRKAQLLQHCDAALKTWGLAGRHLQPFGSVEKIVVADGHKAATVAVRGVEKRRWHVSVGKTIQFVWSFSTLLCRIRSDGHHTRLEEPGSTAGGGDHCS